jgi:NADPH:quinone reductase-like Zn-dependent oxidoreductase
MSAKGLAFEKFGKDTPLLWTDVPSISTLKSNEVLIKVSTASINPVDWKFKAGFLGPFAGSKTAKQVAGFDYCGIVDKVGPNVTSVAVGEKVFGRIGSFPGTHQEYVVVDTKKYSAIAKVPSTVSDEEAGAAGVAVLTGWAGLVTFASEVKEGTKPRVLIVGGSGGVGHVALQIAKNCLDASFVVSVNSSKNTAFVKEMGADEVIEYDKVDLNNLPKDRPEWKQSFDVIMDCVGEDLWYNPLGDFLLKPKAPFTAAAPPAKDMSMSSILGIVGKLAYRSMLGSHPYRLISSLPDKDWPRLVQWMAEGKIKPHIAKVYAMQDGAQAYQDSMGGRTVGKLVLKN